MKVIRVQNIYCIYFYFCFAILLLFSFALFLCDQLSLYCGCSFGFILEFCTYPNIYFMCYDVDVPAWGEIHHFPKQSEKAR